MELNSLLVKFFIMSRGLIRGEIGGHANEAAYKIIPKGLLLRLQKLILYHNGYISKPTDIN